MSILNLILGISAIILNYFAITKIVGTKKIVSALTNNDLKHLNDDVKELKTDFKSHKTRVWDKYNELENKVEKIGKAVGYLEGQLNKK